MAIPLSTVDDLATFTGRPASSFGVLGDFANQAISQATLLFSLSTGLSDLPANEPWRQLAINGILDMAHHLYLNRLYADMTDVPLSAENIGTYSYSKFTYARLASKVKLGEDTGVMWFDMAVERLSIWDLGNSISSTGISVFENDGVRRIGEHRWVPGPAAYSYIYRNQYQLDPYMAQWFSTEVDYAPAIAGWYVGEGDYPSLPSPSPLINIGGGSSDGDADEHEPFIYHQNTPSSEWVVNHYLNDSMPNVVVVDFYGNEVEVEIDYVDNNTLIILATPPLAGMASISS